MRNGNHVIVIGAGIIGASIAFFLARQGANVTVVDAGKPGDGTSAVSFAWMNARDKEPRHYQDLNRRSLDMWDRFARLLEEDVGLTWGGELRWTATAAGAEKFVGRVKMLQSWGYPIELLNAAQVREREPDLVTGVVAAASHSTADGHVDTGKVIAACLARAAGQGAVVHAETPVTGLRLASGAEGAQTIAAVQLGDEEITGDAVVLAAGADSPALARLAGLDVPVEHTFGATLITEPLEPLFQTAAVVHTPTDLEIPIAMRQFTDGTVMVHGGDGGTVGRSLGQTDEEVARVMRAATSFVPALEGVQLKEIRRGRRPIPGDQQSILGFTQDVPNLYLAVTHSGVTLAPLIGETAAQEIINGARVDFLEPYRLERF
jgi:glycine/D-amino acid oxidase-like deaminating enzyme